MPGDEHTYRQHLHAKTGETITVPYTGRAGVASRADFALFEMRDDVIHSDRFEALAVRNGLLELRGLAAGDYVLWLKQTSTRIRVGIVDGTVRDGFVLGRLRCLQVPALKPVQIAAVDANNEQVMRLTDVSPFARVHVCDSVSAGVLGFHGPGQIRAAELLPSSAHAESTYLTGRNIGDEYRCVSIKVPAQIRATWPERPRSFHPVVR